MEIRKDITTSSDQNLSLNKGTNFPARSFLANRTQVSLTKVEKIVTAIYMVTDFMDKAEPIKDTLRAQSLELFNLPKEGLLERVVSLINVCMSMNLISPMNGSILKNELMSLSPNSNNEINIADILRDIKDNTLTDSDALMSVSYTKPTAIVSKRTSEYSRTVVGDKVSVRAQNSSRRETIIKVMKDKNEVTIKDIALSVSDCSEKTIQRELMSLISDGLIKRTGDKRWSKYSLI